MGFRANWDVKPNTVIHPKRRVSASQHNSYYGSYLNPNNQNENVYYQNNQFQPNSYYRTVIQSAVQRAYEWLVKNEYYYFINISFIPKL